MKLESKLYECFICKHPFNLGESLIVGLGGTYNGNTGIEPAHNTITSLMWCLDCIKKEYDVSDADSTLQQIRLSTTKYNNFLPTEVLKWISEINSKFDAIDLDNLNEGEYDGIIVIYTRPSQTDWFPDIHIPENDDEEAWIGYTTVTKQIRQFDPCGHLHTRSDLEEPNEECGSFIDKVTHEFGSRILYISANDTDIFIVAILS